MRLPPCWLAHLDVTALLPPPFPARRSSTWKRGALCARSSCPPLATRSRCGAQQGWHWGRSAGEGGSRQLPPECSCCWPSQEEQAGHCCTRPVLLWLPLPALLRCRRSLLAAHSRRPRALLCPALPAELDAAGGDPEGAGERGGGHGPHGAGARRRRAGDGSAGGRGLCKRGAAVRGCAARRGRANAAATAACVSSLLGAPLLPSSLLHLPDPLLQLLFSPPSPPHPQLLDELQELTSQAQDLDVALIDKKIDQVGAAGRRGEQVLAAAEALPRLPACWPLGGDRDACAAALPC